jgi:hypothetical protein
MTPKRTVKEVHIFCDMPLGTLLVTWGRRLTSSMPPGFYLWSGGAKKFVCKLTDVSRVSTVSIIAVNFVTTRRYIPEDSILHTHHHENLKSHITDV